MRFHSARASAIGDAMVISPHELGEQWSKQLDHVWFGSGIARLDDEQLKALEYERLMIRVLSICNIRDAREVGIGDSQSFVACEMCRPTAPRSKECRNALARIRAILAKNRDEFDHQLRNYSGELYDYMEPAARGLLFIDESDKRDDIHWWQEYESGEFAVSMRKWYVRNLKRDKGILGPELAALFRECLAHRPDLLYPLPVRIFRLFMWPFRRGKT